jgi:hypothetical protein
VRGPAAYLVSRSARNWIRGLWRKLRSPRYAAAILIGAAYVALLLFGQRHAAGGALPARTVALGGSVFLALVVAKWWLFGADRLALAFTPAEIQFFFPAPVSRSALLAYKLLRAQRLILVNVLVWTFLLRRGIGADLGTIPYAVSMWVFFTTLFCHRLGVALTRDAITEHGRAGLRRAWPVMLAVLVVVGATWLSVQHLPPGGLAGSPEGPLDGIERLFGTPPLSWILWPFRIPLLTLSAHGVGDWLQRLLVSLLLLGVHVVWVIRADRAFEEAAVEASARREQLIERWKRHGPSAQQPVRGTRVWIRLGATGHPVAAIVWKNITRLVRTVSLSFVITMMVIIALAVILSVAEGHDPAFLEMVGTLALGWAAMLGVLGPQWIRIDLRGEMEHLAMLRTWPLSGTSVMSGQVLSSAAVLTGLELLLSGCGLAALAFAGEVPLRPVQLAVLVVVGLLVVAGLNLVSLCFQNGAALLYPNWVRTSIRPGGIEQVGQQLLTSGIALLLLAVAALGPGLVAAGTVYLLQPDLHIYAWLPAGLLAAAGLGLEAFLLLDWLGARFERADPTAF